MKFSKYRKVKMPSTLGFTKGVKTSQTKTFWKDGKSPYKIGQVVIVLLKGEKKPALIEKITDCGVSVIMEEFTKIKSIRFNNVMSIVS